MPKYTTFNYPNSYPGDKTLLTGIRQVKNSNKIYISGWYEPAATTVAGTVPPATFKSFVYKGKLDGAGKFYTLSYPSAPNKTVIVTNLYGPNNMELNYMCDSSSSSSSNSSNSSNSSSSSSKSRHEIQVVGNYTIQEKSGAFGCLYEGKLNGKGKWTTILPPSSEPVINTICHSTHGGLVVGNFDTQLDEGRAFIYNIKTKKYYFITQPNIKSITAYGIWYNGKNNYTICGGYTALNISTGFSSAYLVDFNLEKKKFINFRTYSYNNDPIKSVITHFDGITSDGKNGFNLTGDTATFGSTSLAFFANVPDKRSKSNTATWRTVSYPGSALTSGNTVLENNVLGVYNGANNSVNGYICSGL